MKKIELEQIIRQMTAEAERLQIFEKASKVAKEHGRAYESVPNTDAYGITDYFDTAWRIEFKGVSIDYKSDSWEGRRLTVKFNSAKVFHAKAEYDRHHSDYSEPTIQSYVPGEWVNHLNDYYANPHKMEMELREELEREFKEREERLWKKSPEVSDKEMEEAEKNFGIKRRKK